ncbi:hypothetical protein SDC9_109840 [bioreactor metagenome]|uniref:Uncharacterized protein n=1 Tax=bioreactor metagenome TaxID=1076179 RepID=A0A645BCA9_9ZZZZ
MQRNIVRKAKRVAGEFFTRTCKHEVVPACKRCFDAKLCSGLLNDAQLAHEVVLLPWHNKSEIQVAEVMENRASAGGTAGQFPLLTLQLLHATFPPGVLVTADDDRTLVLPEIECRPFPLRLEEQLFERKVLVGIYTGCL